MILQCDQCNTRFRLDDAKLKPGGVKVRCSKCRHVFLAGAELKHEESEFDAILSGLGAPAPEQREQVAAETAGFTFDEEAGTAPAAPEAATAPQPAAERAPQQESADFSAFDFPSEPFPSQEKPAQEPSDFCAFDLAPEAPLQQEVQAAPAAPALDYGEFAFEEEPAALREEPAPAPAESLDFGEFSFPAEPAAGQEQPAPAATADPDFSEFDFDAEPAEKPQAPPAAAADLDYGEFSFATEAPPKTEEPAAAADEAFDFADFSFAEEPAIKPEEAAAASSEALDYGDFSFAEEPAQQEEAAAASSEALDYGDFSFAEEPAIKPEEAAAASSEALDYGDFSFAEEPAIKPEEPAAASSEALEYGDFSFAEEPAALKEAPAPAASDDFGSFSFGEDLQPRQPEAAPVADDAFAFGAFSFPEETAGKPAAAAAEEPAAVPPRPDAASHGPTPPPIFAAAKATKPVNGETALDFGFAAAPVPTRGPEEVEGEEVLPPLSIASRRKGRSLLTASIVVISVLVIVALSGAGLYLLQSGPAAFEHLGLGFVAKWFGMESAEEGRITVRNPLAAFHQNKEAGEIFVVTGEAVNSFRMARASIRVKVSLFDKNGAVLLQKTAYCGNRLSPEQLATLPMEKIESIMNNQFGDSLANLGVQPGRAIGFVVAIANVPKEAADFGVEVVGSTVAGK
ncbi:MAG TPA: DUF3426 domain-containing protein [Geomonas sp.]